MARLFSRAISSAFFWEVIIIQETSIKLSPEQEKHLNKCLESLEAQAALEVVRRIQAAGYEAYWAGGCVRDLILLRQPNDYDVASSASPEELEKIFEKTVAVGRQFGILRVLILIDNQWIETEVARFRGEEGVADGRHPAKVFFTDVKKDAERRDFTINALYLDLPRRMIMDFVGGLVDLQQRQIRAVGDPRLRFQEDHLRILRALRFSAQLGFAWDADLERAIDTDLHLAGEVSGERFFEEWGKLLQSDFAESLLTKAYHNNWLQELFPSLSWNGLEYEQICLRARGKNFDVWLLFLTWAYKSGTSTENCLNFIDQLKVSRIWRRQMSAGMSWLMSPEAWQTKSLGELIALSFDRAQFSGMELSLLLSLDPLTERQQQWLQAKAKYDYSQAAPEPLLRGADLGSMLKGAGLGQRLQQAYWAQLEGQFGTKEEAMVWAIKKP